jgi:hypothetical protein
MRAAAQKPDEPFVLFTRLACSTDFREDNGPNGQFLNVDGPIPW